MTTWTPCDHYRVSISGRVVCLEDLQRANLYDLAQIAVVLVPLVVALSLLLWQLRKARLEREQLEAERQARYHRFLELLRYVRLRLMAR